MGFAGDHKEDSKKAKNGPKCYEHGWECILLVVETYGVWGEKAHKLVMSTWHGVGHGLSLQCRDVKPSQLDPNVEV